MSILPPLFAALLYVKRHLRQLMASHPEFQPGHRLASDFTVRGWYPLFRRAITPTHVGVLLESNGA